MQPKLATKILLAVTSPISWTFYRGIPGRLRAAGFEPILLSAPGRSLQAISEEECVPTIAVPMERSIALVKDLRSLWRLCRIMRIVQPDIVDAGTPKAGLLVGLAARIQRVPRRVYRLLGLRLETETGFKRLILWITEWIACACANQVVCVSPSLRERVVALKLVSREKTAILANGSCGVDTTHFVPEMTRSVATRKLSREVGIPEGAPVIGFVGRLVKDKGIRELVAAFIELRRSLPDLHLLLVGGFEEEDSIDQEIREAIHSTPGIVRVGFVSDPDPYYKLMDVVALPTYREGFPQISLEAQASGIPVVTTDATGARDSVIHGITGIVVPVGNSIALAAAIARLLADPEFRARMGQAGRDWVVHAFRREIVWDAQVDLYQTLSTTQSAGALESFCKRIFDLCVALLALFLLSPLFFVIAIFVRLFLGGPILFRQSRPGLQGRCFTLFKFRTMKEICGPNGEGLPDAERLTPFGRFLRSTSLDELPELLNVIRGEMSLVGPRPLLPQYLDRYTPEQMRRHWVKPGITGWAQINGRNSLDWQQKFALDLWYVEHHSFSLDVRILARTIWQVLRRDGIAQEGHATMPEFLGIAASHEKGNA
jgi:lipopolysaccharide/colanic/teichoic acid biosynthesis glycosyltransferase